MIPSVVRLLREYQIKDTKKIKGTGVRGMLTKSDVLAYVGQASSPTGSAAEKEEPTRDAKTKKPKPEPIRVSF